MEREGDVGKRFMVNQVPFIPHQNTSALIQPRKYMLYTGSYFMTLDINAFLAATLVCKSKVLHCAITILIVICLVCIERLPF
jgi:hypothetical protein